MNFDEAMQLCRRFEGLNVCSTDWSNKELRFYSKNGNYFFANGTNRYDRPIREAYLIKKKEDLEYKLWGSEKIANTRTARKIHGNNILFQDDEYLIIYKENK